MTLVFDLPECAPTVVQRLDPRWKLASVLVVTLACALLQTLGPALAALAGALAVVLLARLPAFWYLRRRGLAMAMFALFLIWLPLTIDDGRLAFSWTGFERLAVLSAKLAAMLSFMLVLLATTPMHHLFKAAGALHIPRLLVLLMLLTYRYVFLLMEEFARLRTALRVRGFRNRANLHSYRTIGQVAGTLLVRSHERSERVAHAMQARGFDGQFRSLDDFSARPADVLGFSMILGYALALIAWDWCARSPFSPLPR